MTWHLLWPVLLVILANTIYNLCAKLTPSAVNAFASLALTYTVAAVASIVLFFVTSPGKSFFAELGKTNWTAIAFGLSIVALEFGYLWIYRVGWKISTASLVANIGLAVVLFVIGVLVFKEALTLMQGLGILLCGLGLFLITR